MSISGFKQQRTKGRFQSEHHSNHSRSGGQLSEPMYLASKVVTLNTPAAVTAPERHENFADVQRCETQGMENMGRAGGLWKEADNACGFDYNNHFEVESDAMWLQADFRRYQGLKRVG